MPDPSSTPVPTSGYRRPRDGAVETAVFAATLAELTDRGYDALTLSTVATRAGVSRETVFTRWRSKQHLVLAAVNDLATRQPVPDTGVFRDDLVAHADALTAVLAHPGAAEVLTSLIVAAQTHEAAAVTLRVGPIAARRLLLRRTVEQAQQRGALSSDVDARTVADAVVGVLCYRLLIAREPLGTDVAQQVVELVAGPQITAHPEHPAQSA